MKTKRAGLQPRAEKWHEKPIGENDLFRRYTVILAYPEEGYDRLETYTTWVAAKSAADAVEHARKRCIRETKCGEWGDPPGSDLEPIAMFAGWLEDLNP